MTKNLKDRKKGQHSCLTAEDVRQIRMAREGLKTKLRKTDPRSYHALSKKYGVSAGALCKIIKRRTWGHVL